MTRGRRNEDEDENEDENGEQVDRFDWDRALRDLPQPRPLNCEARYAIVADRLVHQLMGVMQEGAWVESVIVARKLSSVLIRLEHEVETNENQMGRVG